jgi:nicotinamide riboside kinase
MKIAILGAEGTGKVQLAQALTEALVVQASGSQLSCAFEPQDALNSDLILLMGLDRLWTDESQDPSAAHRRAQEDASLRQSLQNAGLNFVVVYGRGTARTHCALQAVLQASAHSLDKSNPQTRAQTPWQWNCDKCSDGACEHRMFTGLLTSGSA